MGNYFRGLAYSLGDEDSVVECEILPYRAGHVVTVAGSGGRVIPLLARAPERLDAIDISPEQIAFTRFRLAALSKLNAGEYARLLGYGTDPLLGEPRRRLISSLSLPEADKDLIGEFHQRHAETPLVYSGKFEQMLRRFSRVIRTVLGKRARELFEITELSEQRRFLKTRFPGRRWKLLVGVLGNSALLNAVLYKGDFPRKNLPGSHFRIYEEIFNRLFDRVLARESFFLQMLILGEVSFAEGFPVECDPATYALARAALGEARVEVRAGDITRSLETPAGGIDFISLSDVPSFLGADAERGILSRLAPQISSGGRIVVRAHLRTLPPIDPPLRDVTGEFSGLIERETTNLWRIAVAERA